MEWPYIEALNFESKFLLPLGVFGVLYPHNCFNKQVINMALIEQLSPKADDLWFKALSMIEGTQVSIANKKTKKPTMIPETQKTTLKKHNVSRDNNRIQWINLMKYFNINANS